MGRADKMELFKSEYLYKFNIDIDVFYCHYENINYRYRDLIVKIDTLIDEKYINKILFMKSIYEKKKRFFITNRCKSYSLKGAITILNENDKLLTSMIQKILK